jgi:hypothetical protein
MASAHDFGIATCHRRFNHDGINALSSASSENRPFQKI